MLGNYANLNNPAASQDVCVAVNVRGGSEGMAKSLGNRQAKYSTTDSAICTLPHVMPRPDLRTGTTMGAPTDRAAGHMARFPVGRIYDQDLPGVRFNAIVGNDTFACAITVDALVSHYGANQRQSEQVLQAFDRNRAAIERIADRLIARQPSEPHRVVVIRSADC
jgi:Protein of unknown function (DUF1488)